MNSHKRRVMKRAKAKKLVAAAELTLLIEENRRQREARMRNVIMIGGPMAGEIFRSDCANIEVPVWNYPQPLRIERYKVRRVRWGKMSWHVGVLEASKEEFHPVKLLEAACARI